MAAKLQQAVSNFRDCWKTLALTDAVYKLLALFVLTPVLGVVFQTLISLSGDKVLSDTDILHFLLGPMGWICFILAAAMWLSIIALEQASLLAILSAQASGQRLGVIGSLRYAASKTTEVFRLVARIVGWTLVWTAPFLAVAGFVYLMLLTEFDINFYLSEKPWQFQLAVAIGCLLILALTWILLRLLSGWFLSLPIVLLEDTQPKQSLRESVQRCSGQRREILVWILLWLLATLLISTLATGMIRLLGQLLVPDATGSLRLMVFGIGSTLLLMLLVNLLINLLSTATFSVVMFTHYRSTASDPDNPASIKVDELQQRSGLKLTRNRMVVAGIIGAAAAAAVGAYSVNRVQLADEVMIMAHRGASKAAPENTLAAIQQAIDDNADWVEIDVQETADGEVVVFHDSDFMKTAKVNLKIWNASAGDLADIDIGSWFAPEFANQRIPTLAQVLDLCKGKIKVNIELKYYGHDEQLEQRVADVVDSRSMASEIMVMSLKRPAVQKMKSIRADWKVGLLMSVAAGDLAKLEGDFLAVNAEFASIGLIGRIHDLGKEIYVWTVNDPATMSIMISRGVDGLLTDRPALARTVLQQRAKLTAPERLLLEFSSMLGVQPKLAAQ